MKNKKAQAAKAISIALDLNEKIARSLKVQAALNDLSPQDQLRDIVGLTVSNKVQRPRISLSLSEEDYDLLSKRYGIDVNQKNEIKRAVMNELNEKFNS